MQVETRGLSIRWSFLWVYFGRHTRTATASLYSHNLVLALWRDRFDQVEMVDCAGGWHEFHFQTRLLGAMVTLEAFELKNGVPAGYQFQIIGDPEDDLFSLMGRLIERMRRRLSVNHLVADGLGLHIAAQTVRAQISSDSEADLRTPLLIIEGKEVSWEQFGRMLMTFEGFQFRMKIIDPSYEV